jgi:hypothetical protein
MSKSGGQDLRSRALSLRSWAESSGLLRAGSFVAGGTSPTSPLDTELFSASAAAAFVRKPITAFGINRARAGSGVIVIYTVRPLGISEKQQLSSSYSGGQELEFQVAKPLLLDPSVSPAIPSTLPALGPGGAYTCGRSISLGNVREAGTMGCLLEAPDGKLYGLSANHVTGGCSSARPGTPIVAPGILDVTAGHLDPRTLGHHIRALALVPGHPSTVDPRRNRDAAVFAILNPEAISSMQGNAYDTPAVVEDPVEDAIVEKFGRSTGLTTGVVESEIVGPHPVTYRSTVYYSAEESAEFRGLVYFEPVYVLRGTSGPFATNGDSGALVTMIAEGRRLAVGILFSGRGSDESYMLPLKPILSDLGMTIVSGHGIS